LLAQPAAPAPEFVSVTATSARLDTDNPQSAVPLN
jgi:hypothetical protein